MATLNPKFKPPEMPAYVPYNIGDLNKLGTQMDTGAYMRSDRDFTARRPGLVSAEKLFENQVLRDQTGDTELLPQLQGEFMRAGLSNALGAFGGATTADGAVAGGTLAPGSAGEAAVARNLGLSIQGFQDRNRQNRMTSLLTAEQLFPRRSFGLSGADAVNLNMANTAGQNNWNQADYATKFQTDQYNYLVDAQNRQAQALEHNQGVMANAAKKGAIWSGVFNSLGSLVGAAGGAAAGGAGGMCWVAREIYGNEETNGVPTWTLFREWMRQNASLTFIHSYATNGPDFAMFLRGNEQLKSAMRSIFDNRIQETTHGL